MNKMARFPALAFLAASALGLASTAARPDSPPASGGFLPAKPGYVFRFPRDHASHPGYKTEWWYYTGHLTTDSGETFGFQWTFFRSGVRPPRPEGGASRWAVNDLFLAHFAVADHRRKTFFFDERFSRGALGEAGADTEHYRVWIKDWRAEALTQKRGAAHRIRAETGSFSIDLTVRPEKPPVIHGLDGTSRKGVGATQTSHYISLTRMKAEGTLTVRKDGTVRNLDVTGTAWMDHEFGSNQLGPDQIGWDWFSIQLEDGSELMLYLIRRKDGSADPFSSGTWIEPDGTSRHLERKDFRVETLKTWTSGRSGGTYPIRWRLRIPSRRTDLRVEPVFEGQELITRKSTKVTYWEGGVTVRGERGNRPVRGVGYVEMTGYAEPFKKKI